MWWEYAIVGVAVAASALFAARTVLRSLRGGKSRGCACTACPAVENVRRPRDQVRAENAEVR